MIDEDMLRDILQRSTEDLFAPSGSAGKALGYCRHHRRRRIRRAVFATGMTGVAAIAVVAAVSLPYAGSPRESVASPLGPTPEQKELYQLASASKAVPKPQGRYAVLTERQDGDLKISVIDSLTGDIWTYQQGAGIPKELPVSLHGSLTSAQFAALPTDPVALRATLIKEGFQQQSQAKLQRPTGTYYFKHPQIDKTNAEPIAFAEGEEENLVFGQATDMLWNPLVGAALRSALYKVLATTPGVVVDPHARDALGRLAVRISTLDAETKLLLATYESPSTGAVLESTFTNLLGPITTRDLALGNDVYLSITWSNSIPPNPFRN